MWHTLVRTVAHPRAANTTIGGFYETSLEKNRQCYSRTRDGHPLPAGERCPGEDGVGSPGRP